MREKYLNAAGVFAAIFCTLWGAFYVFGAIFAQFPLVFENYTGFGPVLFVLLENFAHTVSFALTVLILGTLSLVRRFGKKEKSAVKHVLYFFALLFSAIGAAGIILNAYSDISGISQFNSRFDDVALIEGYVARFDFIVLLVVFIMCGIHAYRAPRGVYPKDSALIVFYLAIALYNVASVMFAAVYNASSVNIYTFVLCALSLVCRPLCVYGAFARQTLDARH